MEWNREELEGEAVRKGIGRKNERWKTKPKGSSGKVAVKVRARAMVGY